MISFGEQDSVGREWQERGQGIYYFDKISLTQLEQYNIVLFQIMKLMHVCGRNFEKYRGSPPKKYFTLIMVISHTHTKFAVV